MLRVGITGGIGSGKTTVCGIFETLGIPVFYADAETKWLYKENVVLQDQIKRVFPEAVSQAQDLDLKKLASLVFHDALLLQKLNAIVHPFVFAHYEDWCRSHSHQTYTLKEAAIMFESGSNKHVHKVVGVIAPRSLRISRIRERDGLNEQEILSRMDKQMSEKDLEKRCDYIIVNDGEQSLIEQVVTLHREFSKNRYDN